MVWMWKLPTIKKRELFAIYENVNWIDSVNLCSNLWNTIWIKFYHRKLFLKSFNFLSNFEAKIIFNEMIIKIWTSKLNETSQRKYFENFIPTLIHNLFCPPSSPSTLSWADWIMFVWSLVYFNHFAYFAVHPQLTRNSNKFSGISTIHPTDATATKKRHQQTKPKKYNFGFHEKKSWVSRGFFCV